MKLTVKDEQVARSWAIDGWPDDLYCKYLVWGEWLSRVSKSHREWFWLFVFASEAS